MRYIPSEHTTTLKAFLALINYCQNHIPNIHKVRVPLNNPLNNGMDMNRRKIIERSLMN